MPMRTPGLARSHLFHPPTLGSILDVESTPPRRLGVNRRMIKISVRAAAAAGLLLGGGAVARATGTFDDGAGS
jgi:hypothetical protein